MTAFEAQNVADMWSKPKKQAFQAKQKPQKPLGY